MDIQELITHHSNDELAAESSMVYQVWEDGEITLTKSGLLLGQRTLHMIEAGWSNRSIDPALFPHHTQNGQHGFIYTDDKGSQAVRNAILLQEV